MTTEERLRIALDALRRMDGLIDRLWDGVPWGKCFLSADDLRELNEAPLQAKRAIQAAEAQEGEG